MSKKIELPEYLRAKILSEEMVGFLSKVAGLTNEDFRKHFKNLNLDSRMTVSDAISTLDCYLPQKSEE